MRFNPDQIERWMMAHTARAKRLQRDADQAALVAQREQSISIAAAQAADQREELIAMVGAVKANEIIQAGVDALFN